MIRIITNVPEFYNDLAEEVRLYLPAEQATLCVEPVNAEDCVVVANIIDIGDHWRAECRCAYEGRESLRIEEREAVAGTELEIKRYRKWLIKVAVFRAVGQLVGIHIPWGSLTGIRPTRLLRELRGYVGKADADRMMTDMFDVTPSKLSLVTEILKEQEPILSSQRDTDFDVYVGIPFCRTLCLYCSFPSSLRKHNTDMKPYLDALEADIRHGAALTARSGLKLRSMYMGGGTPTVLTADELDRLLSVLIEAYGGFGSEFTVEAGRPDTITSDKLRVLKRHGVGRISVNPQTMAARTLELIGRSHTPDEIVEAYETARSIGFDSINMDMICGLPGETGADADDTLTALMALEPENITVHTLAIKRSSRLREAMADYPMPDAGSVDVTVARCRTRLSEAGYAPYYMYRQKYMAGNLENVGFTRPDKACIYNVDMMEETTSIMAHGASSMSKRIFGGEHRVERIPNPKNIERYIEKLPEIFAAKEALFADV